MQYWWLVGLGGAAGSICRYGLNILFLPVQKGFPWSTFTVNILGSFLIGLLAAMLAGPESERWRLLAMTGFLGGFTTFSTFSIENMRMLQQGDWTLSATYTVLSVVGGVAFSLLGYWIGQK